MESVTLLLIIATILLLGFLAQWFSWYLGIPSIILLFTGGLLVGPFTGLLAPDALLGQWLFPAVSALIGIVLFEGGLTLKFKEVENLRDPVLRVILIGGTITFLLTTCIAYYLLHFPISLSFLLGGVLVVTGPTVVIPLLHQIRPEGNVGSVARWEGIMIDPLGAILAVIVFEIILAGSTGAAHGFLKATFLFSKTILVGTVIGLSVAYVLTELFRRYWIPDFLHNFAILSGVLGAQALSNHFYHEAGLLAVTIMGIYMANQNKIAVRHILHFKEDLRVLFISILFIILVARLDQSFLYNTTSQQLLFLGSLIVLVRPAAILLSTWGTNLTWPERGFLSWIAPRGIVAAAVSSIFSEELQHAGLKQAAILDDITFFVIAGTVLIYGFTLSPISKLLGLSESKPQGILIIGAQRWARALASVLQDKGVKVRLVDKNRNRIVRARQANLNAQHLDIMTESELQTVNIQGIGYFLALTRNDEVNTLAALHALDLGFDRSEVYQLKPSESFTDDSDDPDPFQGRYLFSEDTNYDTLQEKYESGWSILAKELEDKETIEQIESNHPDKFIPLVLLREDGDVFIYTNDTNATPSPGDQLIVLQKT